MIALGIVFWDGCLRGHRTRRALALATRGGVIVSAGGVLQAVRSDGWGWLLVVPATGAVALAERVDRRNSARGQADGPESGASSRDYGVGGRWSVVALGFALAAGVYKRHH